MQTEKVEQDKIHQELVNEIILKDKSIVQLKIENLVDFTIFTPFDYIAKNEDMTPHSHDIIKKGCCCDDESFCHSKSLNCCPNKFGLVSPFDKENNLVAREYGLIVECSELCACKAECNNHVINPMLEIRLFKTSDGRGWGLQTLRK